MLKWIQRRRIERLLIKRAWLQGYVDAWGSPYLVAYEHAKIEQIDEILRQLGYKEQDNG